MRKFNSSSSRAKSLLFATSLSIAGCGGPGSEAGAGTEAVALLEKGLGVSALSACGDSLPGTGWSNSFIPVSTAATGPFTVQFRAWPYGPEERPTIDGVIGLSNGPADAFTDLGPIVLFHPYGYIQARNGSAYVGAFPYRGGDGGYEFQMLVDVSTRRYSVWVRHLVGNTPFEALGLDLAFRTEQSAVTRLDNIGVINDGDQGLVQAPCGFGYSSATSCTESTAGVWKSQPFASQTGVFRLEFIATPESAAVDAVIGASRGVPAAFAQLAAAVRFRPDGLIDARNGGAYAADATFAYYAGTAYTIAFDIDRPQHTYSVSVARRGQEYEAVTIAHNYAFRTQQAQVASLDRLGQYVDGTPGSVKACSLILVQ
jgi:hypothetical protein